MPLIKYLLDTNICIYIIKQKPLHLLQRFTQLQLGEMAISVITYGELFFGAEKSTYKEKTHNILQEFSKLISVLPITDAVAQHYGSIRATLEKKSQMIGNNDLWIAAHASAIEVTLVTNNTKEFERVPHLKLENWV